MKDKEKAFDQDLNELVKYYKSSKRLYKELIKTQNLFEQKANGLREQIEDLIKDRFKSKIFTDHSNFFIDSKIYDLIYMSYGMLRKNKSVYTNKEQGFYFRLTENGIYYGRSQSRVSYKKLTDWKFTKKGLFFFDTSCNLKFLFPIEDLNKEKYQKLFRLKTKYRLNHEEKKFIKDNLKHFRFRKDLVSRKDLSRKDLIDLLLRGDLGYESLTAKELKSLQIPEISIFDMIDLLDNLLHFELGFDRNYDLDACLIKRGYRLQPLIVDVKFSDFTNRLAYTSVPYFVKITDLERIFKISVFYIELAEIFKKKIEGFYEDLLQFTKSKRIANILKGS